MREHIARFRADADSVGRYFNIAWSESRLSRFEAFLSAELDRLGEIDFAALDQESRVDYLLLRNHIRSRLNSTRLERSRLGEMEALLPVRGDIIELEEARWRMETPDPAGAAARLAGFKDRIAAARTRVEKGREPDGGGAPDALRVSPVTALRAANAARSLRGTLRTWFTHHDGYQPEFSWWNRRPYEEASAALEDYAKFLREIVAGVKGGPDDPLIGDPIGRDTLVEDLRNEGIIYGPEELIVLAEREFAWCEARMLEAARDMGLGEDWRAALERVKESHVPPGRQAELVAEQARHAIDFVRDLVTIPPLCEELWRLSMLSPEGQRVLPFAAYNDQHMLVAYPTDAMPHADKLMSMRGNNRHFSRIVTPHELIPGHHLQLFVAERERPHRALFRTPFFVEGWALYWEMKLWDMGYAETPEDRIGMLFWRMHRCARIIISLKFHLGETTPEEMIEFLVSRVGHERFGATSEVRRYVGGDYSPLYQVAYMIGGLQLRALYAETVSTGRLREREFNDAVLRCNSIPFELVRAELLGTPLSRDWEPAWRFAGSGLR